MNKQLASAVVDTFRRAEGSDHAARLKSFPERAWEKTFHWLDASGLALYFLRELQKQAIQSAVPATILFQLERRQQQNVRRTASLFEEFARVNTAFRASGLQYVNLKGFTLAPDFCPDLSLRYQTDCDFLMSRSDAEKCSAILKSLGYGLVAANVHVLEFKTDVGTTPRLEDLYNARPERSVEIHLCNAARADRDPELLDRCRQTEIAGSSYPALSREDMFLLQACHLFQHLRSEWTRISWALELRHFVVGCHTDTDFWSGMNRRLNDDTRNANIAVAVALRFAETLLGPFAPRELAASTLAVPSETASWIARYARKVALTDFPGSKLCLLLEQTLSNGAAAPSLRSRLFPLRLPAPVVLAPTKGLRQRMQALSCRAGYFAFRLKFHARSTSQYLWEKWLWKRKRNASILRPYTPNQVTPALSTDRTT